VRVKSLEDIIPISPQNIDKNVVMSKVDLALSIRGPFDRKIKNLDFINFCSFARFTGPLDTSNTREYD
jgi:hypothetical protein